MLKYALLLFTVLLVGCVPYPYSRTGVYYNYSTYPETYYSYTPIYTPEPVIYPRVYPYPHYYYYQPAPVHHPYYHGPIYHGPIHHPPIIVQNRIYRNDARRHY